MNAGLDETLNWSNTMTHETKVGSTIYHVSPATLRRIKAAVKYASPNGSLTWQSIATRPASVKQFLDAVEVEMNAQAK
tara:strand:- start:2688 stop:2921 length:234 start_codon:yes stop_codon:yes gene_type:complete